MFASTRKRDSVGAGTTILDVESSTNYPHISTNGTYYVAPIPLGQAPVQVVAYQPPPGYALVPMAEVSWWNIFCPMTWYLAIVEALYEFCPSLWQKYEPNITIAKWQKWHTRTQSSSFSSFLFHNNISFLFQLQASGPESGNPTAPPSYEKAVA